MTQRHQRVERPTRPQLAAAASAVDPLDLHRLVACGVIDIIGGDPLVPITVIRLADTDLPNRHDGDMPTSLAILLLGLYTDVGDTVVSFDADPRIEGVCGGGGRRYLHVTDRAHVTDLDQVAGRAALVIINWPRQANADDAALTELFIGCRRLMAPDGKLIITVFGEGADGHLYVREAEHLMPAALTAGLGYFRRFVAVFAPILGERRTRHASPVDGAVLRQTNHITVHRDIAVLSVRRRGRHA